MKLLIILLTVCNGLTWSKECQRELLELLKAENDRGRQGEESIITKVSEKCTTMETTSVTSVITSTVSTKVSTTTEWLELTTSIFMERKYTSFYT